MASLGFVDCWAEVGRPGSVGTCRFSTHIDYVYANDEMLNEWECVDVVHHVNNDASDHSPVIATFDTKDFWSGETLEYLL